MASFRVRKTNKEHRGSQLPAARGHSRNVSLPTRPPSLLHPKVGTEPEQRAPLVSLVSRYKYLSASNLRACRVTHTWHRVVHTWRHLNIVTAAWRDIPPSDDSSRHCYITLPYTLTLLHISLHYSLLHTTTTTVLGEVGGGRYDDTRWV